MQTQLSRSRFVTLLLTGITTIGVSSSVQAAVAQPPVKQAPSAERIVQTQTPKPQGTVLSEGATGSSVRSLQQRLKAKGFYAGAVDGAFGPSTKAAVIAFQKARGLPADGVAGAKTLAALGSTSTASSSSTPTASTSTSASSSSSSSQSSQTSSSTGTTQGTSSTAGTPVAVADRFYWSGAKGNLGLSITGKFTSSNKLAEAFDLTKVIGVYNGKQWKLSDILVSTDFNVSGSGASWRVSGPRPVLERYLASLKSGYQNRSLLYDFGFSEVNYRPTAYFE